MNTNRTSDRSSHDGESSVTRATMSAPNGRLQESNHIHVATNVENRNDASTTTNQHIDDNDDDDDENNEYLISCRCESAKVISTLLSCLKHVNSTRPSAQRNTTNTSNGHIRSSSQRRVSNSTSRFGSSTVSSSSSLVTLQPVTIFCSPTTLTFHILNTSKQIQASVDISANLFSDYSVASTTNNNNSNNNNDPNQEDWATAAGGEFCVNLSTLLECLHSLGTHNLDKTKLCFSYNTTQDIFKMELLEESGILSTAAIPGMLSPHLDDDNHDDINLRTNSLAHSFRLSAISARIIVKSESLHELVAELDFVAGGTMATVSLGIDGLKIRVVGYLGECQVVLPPKGNHVVSIEIPPTDTATAGGTAASHTLSPPTLWTYPLHALMESMRGLDIAEETCITMNTGGMMAIQHQVLDNTISDTPSFVDFILCCMHDDDDDNENDDHHIATETTNQRATLCDLHDNPVSTCTIPNQPTARIVSQMKCFNADDTNSDDSHALSTARPSAERLFGSVMAEREPLPNPLASPIGSIGIEVLPVHRRRRSSRSAQIRPPPYKKNRFQAIVQKKKTKRGIDWDDEDESQDGRRNSDDDEEAIDATVAPSSPSRPKSRYRRQEEIDDGCSSPELLYGQQH
jgi:hypothetical protein